MWWVHRDDAVVEKHELDIGALRQSRAAKSRGFIMDNENHLENHLTMSLKAQRSIWLRRPSIILLCSKQVDEDEHTHMHAYSCKPPVTCP